MSYARCLAGIDEPALRLEQFRVSTRDHQGAINPPKHAIQRFGARHIPFDEFDIWQFRERDSPRPIAHQRAHRYAVARKFTYNRGAVQAGSAGYQDHVYLPSLRVQWSAFMQSCCGSPLRNEPSRVTALPRSAHSWLSL